jgi:hypothetical protein
MKIQMDNVVTFGVLYMLLGVRLTVQIFDLVVLASDTRPSGLCAFISAMNSTLGKVLHTSAIFATMRS